MKQIFKFICCGSVDDGKSTLIGRMLLDTGNVKKDQLEDAQKASLKNGSSHFEPAMLLDGLLDERAQQITIDVAHRYFDYQNVRFHILDCPGHVQYTKNMAIAAAQAQAAIVVIDVTKGIREQTKNHIRICDLFHIPFLCICLTKCDLLPGKGSFAQRPAVKKLMREIKTLLSKYHFKYAVFPVSAITGYQTQPVLQALCLQTQKSAKQTQTQKKRVLHVLAAKLYHGNRYYYTREVGGLEVKPGKYWVYPQRLPLTITQVISPGCFQIKEDIDIAPGDCITNTKPLVNNLIKHQTIWFETPTENLLLKHGSRVVRVVRYTDDTLELDQPLIFHNIEDLKMNGFGVFIDEVSKKTLGCCVFTGNKQSSSMAIPSGKIYYLEGANNVFKAALKTVLGISVYLETEVLKKDLFAEQKSVITSVETLARYLTKQGMVVGIVAKTLPQKPFSDKETASAFGAQLRVEHKRVYVTAANGRQFSVPLREGEERTCAEEIKKQLVV